MLKKLLTSLLLGLIILFSFAPLFEAKAQSWYNQGPFDWYLKVYDPSTSPSNEIFGERYTAAQVQWVFYSVAFMPINIFYGFLGMEPTPNICLAGVMTGTIQVDSCLSAIPDFINALADKIKLPSVSSYNLNNQYLANKNDKLAIWKQVFLQDRPISGFTYVRNLAKKFTLVSEVQAQSTSTFGFSRLAPILPLWKITRNIAYFFFVLITIIAAFMIMFKVKISPQAVITLQSAIPKIIVSILLVTFSYAIAGFMVDLVYVVMGLFSQFFTPMLFNQGGVNAGLSATYGFLNGWLGDGFWSILIYDLLYIVSSLLITIVIFLISIGSGLVVGNVASMVMAILLFVFFAINILILLYYLFGGLFTLFRVLATFYLAVILGPIQLAFGALPTSRGTFGNWLKSLVAKLAVFPAQGILWYFAFLFLFGALASSIGCTRISQPTWVPGGGLQNTITSIQNGFQKVFINTGAPPDLISQFIGFAPQGNCWAPPLLGDASQATAIAFLILSAGCILMLTKVSKAIEKAIAGQPFDIATELGQPVKQVVSISGAAIESAGKAGENPLLAGIGGVMQGAAR